MGEIIDRHYGCVVEFLGDGMLCVFGTPNALPDHAELAVRCAVAMQARLAKANAEWGRVRRRPWRR